MLISPRKEEYYKTNNKKTLLLHIKWVKNLLRLPILKLKNKI